MKPQGMSQALTTLRSPLFLLPARQFAGRSISKIVKVLWIILCFSLSVFLKKNEWHGVCVHLTKGIRYMKAYRAAYGDFSMRSCCSRIQMPNATCVCHFLGFTTMLLGQVQPARRYCLCCFDQTRCGLMGIRARVEPLTLQTCSITQC